MKAGQLCQHGPVVVQSTQVTQEVTKKQDLMQGSIKEKGKKEAGPSGSQNNLRAERDCSVS